MINTIIASSISVITLLVLCLIWDLQNTCKKGGTHKWEFDGRKYKSSYPLFVVQHSPIKCKKCLKRKTVKTII